MNQKARKEGIDNLQTILAKLDDPKLPPKQVDVAFFMMCFTIPTIVRLI